MGNQKTPHERVMEIWGSEDKLKKEVLELVQELHEQELLLLYEIIIRIK